MQHLQYYQRDDPIKQCKAELELELKLLELELELD